MSDAPPMPPSIPWWSRFGNLSQMISASAALIALLFVAYQVNQIEVNGRKANARSVYLSYSNAGLRYPRFIAPDYDALKADPVTFQQYKWYVSHMLFAYDEILSIVRDAEWQSSFDYEAPHHTRLLCELKRSDPAFFTQFYDRMNRLIDAMLKGKCAAP